MGSQYDDKFSRSRRVYEKAATPPVGQASLTFEGFQNDQAKKVSRGDQATELVKKGGPILEWARSEYRSARRDGLGEVRLKEIESLGSWIREALELLGMVAMDAPGDLEGW